MRRLRKERKGESLKELTCSIISGQLDFGQKHWFTRKRLKNSFKSTLNIVMLVTNADTSFSNGM